VLREAVASALRRAFFDGQLYFWVFLARPKIQVKKNACFFFCPC
jgi:hypothetical protein